MKPLFAAKSIF